MDGAVVRVGGEARAVGVQGQAVGVAVVILDQQGVAVGREVPDQHRAVDRASEEAVALRAEAQTADLAELLRGAQNPRSGVQAIAFEQVDLGRVIGQGDVLAVRGDREHDAP